MRLWPRIFSRVEALPVPVVAGVQGLALAGGLEPLLVADLVVMDVTARLGDQHANFGLVAGGGGGQRLPSLIGACRAKELHLFHGHYGYTDELPFEQRMRDVIGLEIGDGTAEVMKTVVARQLMGRESLPY